MPGQKQDASHAESAFFAHTASGQGDTLRVITMAGDVTSGAGPNAVVRLTLPPTMNAVQDVYLDTAITVV